MNISTLRMKDYVSFYLYYEMVALCHAQLTAYLYNLQNPRRGRMTNMFYKLRM